jgi:hypothetical protein
MTDPAAAALPRPGATRTAPRQRAAARSTPRRPSATGVLTGTLAVFLACFTFLAWQLHAGNDPSLGRPVAQAAPRVLVKRVERKVVVTTEADDDGAAAAAGSGTGGSSVQVVQSSPAPAAAPAPTTRSS